MRIQIVSILFAWALAAATVDHQQVQAFSVSNNPNNNMAVRPDASSAVEEALKITAAFGIGSKEAKVAWDTVEELDASDNRCVLVIPKMCPFFLLVNRRK